MKTINIIAIVGIVISLSSCKKEKENLPDIKHPSTHDTTTLIVPIPPTTSVYYSDWLTPDASSTGPLLPGGGGGSGQTGNTGPGKPAMVQYFHVIAAGVTQEVLDKGVVLAFCKLENDNNLTRSLPTTTMINNFISIWDFVLEKGKVHFMQTTGNPMGVLPISNKNKFRYVIISATKHVRLSKPLKEMSYDEVCEMFGIPK
ncbi:MAG: hypothetical protein U0T31_10630 [Chitinophagales bacterium]|nr:hypothetical protein [Chitinophagales bacterium]